MSQYRYKYKSFPMSNNPENEKRDGFITDLIYLITVYLEMPVMIICSDVNRYIRLFVLHMNNYA